MKAVPLQSMDVIKKLYRGLGISDEYMNMVDRWLSREIDESEEMTYVRLARMVGNVCKENNAKMCVFDTVIATITSIGIPKTFYAIRANAFFRRLSEIMEYEPYSLVGAALLDAIDLVDKYDETERRTTEVIGAIINEYPDYIRSVLASDSVIGLCITRNIPILYVSTLILFTYSIMNNYPIVKAIKEAGIVFRDEVIENKNYSLYGG